MKLTFIDGEPCLEHDQFIPISKENYDKLLQMNEFQVKQYLYTTVLEQIKIPKYKSILETWLKDENISWKLN